MSPTPTILIIDDESDSRSLLKDLLAPEGYRVRSADSGELALTSLANYWLPDLVLLDIRMPGMDGFEVYRRIRANEKLSNIPVIFISAANAAEERVRGLALGAVDYINKPFQREELLARVRTHVELGRLRAELENRVSERTTELRNTVDRLRESELRFRTLADTAPVMIWVSGTDKLCTFVNKTWLAFTGRDFEKEQGTVWTKSLHPADLDRCHALYSASFDAREEFEMEYRLRRADGEYRWVLDKGTPRFTRGGNFAGYIASATDITDLKRGQEEALSRQKLQRLIALTLNDMVSAIVAQAELAEIGLTAGSEPADGVRQIKAVALRASEAVRELMAYSGEEPVALEAVDLSDLIEEMSESLKTSISKRALLDLDLCKDLPPLQGNATQLRQLMTNLIINASQTIGESGGSIHVRTSFSMGRAYSGSANDANLQDGYVRLQVSDTGCGTTEAQKARISDPCSTIKAQGHGLRLAVVQGIVNSHGGSINVLSAPGIGTTFEALFPARATTQLKAVSASSVC